MGIGCSKRKTSDKLVTARVSPFGGFRRRSFQPRRWQACADGSLLSLSLDAACASLRQYDPEALRGLPPDVAQLLLDRLLERGQLTDGEVLSLQGQCFYDLQFNAFPGEIREVWLRFLATPDTLQTANFSRTTITDAVLSSLPSLPHLHTLHLEYCVALTDRSLSTPLLTRLPALRDLSLAGCEGLGPLAATCIGRCTALRRLSLKQCHGIRGLAALRHLAVLEQLDLGWCTAVGDADVAALSTLTTLQDLHLSHTRVSSAALPAVAALQGLTALALGGLQLTDASLADALRCLPLLKVLDLERSSQAGGLALAALAGAATGLEELNLSYTGVDDEGLGALAGLPRLRRLEMDQCHVSNRGLDVLSSLHRLEELNLSDTAASDPTIVALSSLPRLRSLDLTFTGVTDAGLRPVARVTSLRRLNLDSRQFTDAALVHVAKLPQLQALDLFGATITDAGCARLAACTALQKLEVCGSYVTDAGVAALAKLPDLRHLSLAQNYRVTNRAMEHLLQMSHLTALNLSQCHVTSSCVVALGCLPHLQVLALGGTRVRSPAVDQLRAINPELEVIGVKPGP